MDPGLVMNAIVIVAILCLVGVGEYGWLAWRRPLGSDALMPVADGPTAARHGSPELTGQRFFAETSDRVVRVLTLIFLASVGVAVFLTDNYSVYATQIELLIAAALLTIVLLQDIVPIKDARVRYWLEAVSAIVFLALLTLLTGGATSPFFVGFLLVVAGASLSLDEMAPFALAVLAGASFSLVVVATNTSSTFFGDLPKLAFDLVILALLA
jgi:hypothetical protein